MAIGVAHTMEAKDWASLAYSIAHGHCILMLGPDAVREQVDGRREPVLNRLSRELMELTDDPSGFDERDFRAVAQSVLSKDLYALQAAAEEMLGTVDVDDPAICSLAWLPFRLIINTAPGVAVDEAWRACKPRTQTAYYDYRPGRAQRPVPEPTIEAPLVYHLYGSLEEPSSLTLTESDLIELLVAIVAENPDLPANLKSMLRDRKHTFLFLGFRLHLWHLRILLHVLAASDPQSHSYALEAVDSVDAGTQQFYRQGHKIHFCDASVDEFVAELARLVDIPDAPEGPAEAAPAYEAAKVFICHASEDANEARQLGDRLRDAGFEIWLDREALRGGDRWGREIERALDDVRFVVVLQTANLAAKLEGYVLREIALARERQTTFRDDLHFMIPVVVDDDANALESLRDLQSIRLYEPDGFDRLRQLLTRDVERWVKK